MNVFDFDRTIYRKDSSIEFYLYVIRKKPLVLFKCSPHQLVALVKYLSGKIEKETFKEAFFSFLKYIDAHCIVKDFVSREMRNIQEWYFEIYQKDDVIVSASPEFLIKEFASNIGVHNVIASQVDIKTGIFLGPNCFGKEKVRRFGEIYELDAIDKFYSDSLSDAPLAHYAQKAFLVSKSKIETWEVKDAF